MWGRIGGRVPQTKVLVADDDRLIRAYLGDLLREKGCSVVEAQDGQAAVETCVREAPELVFLDLLMPKLNGFEALKQIRARAPAAKVVLLTALSDGTVAKLGGANPIEADASLEKPFKPAQIDALLKRLVATRS
jgi:CheY-like chemotaxis protein